MATVRLPLTLAIFNGSGWPNLGISNTTAGTLVGFVSSDPFGADAQGVLFDGSDVTYVQMVGDSAASQGAGGRAGGFGMQALGGRIPINSTLTGATFSCRLRKSGCEDATVSVFRGATAFPELGYLPQFSVTGSGFQDYNLDLTFVPQSILPGTPWTSASYSTIDNAAGWGFVAMTDCPAGGSQTIDVSEAFLDVAVTPPTPVVVTGVASTGAAAATLNGTVNPNQSQMTVFGINGFVSLLFPVSWQFYYGRTPTSLAAIGTPQGEFICGPPNNNATPDNIDHPIATSKTWAVSTNLSNLSPGTTYYYALAAIVDGITTFGSTASFITPLLDPSFGAY